MPWPVPAVLLAVVLTACGTPGAPDPVATTPPTPGPTVTTSSPEPGPTTPVPTAREAGTASPANADALAFTAPALSGGTIEGAELAGGDVVLWMWAPW